MSYYINNVALNGWEMRKELGDTIYTLKPLENQQKSFYNKAHVVIEGETAYLYSYNTKVLEYDMVFGLFQKTWNGWSKTTMEHVKAFVGVYIPKKAWNELREGALFSYQQARRVAGEGVSNE